MNGEELFNKLSKRDFTGSPADDYAQHLQTIYHHVSGSGELEAFYSMLEKAHASGKRIEVVNEEADEIVMADLAVS